MSVEDTGKSGKEYCFGRFVRKIFRNEILDFDNLLWISRENISVRLSHLIVFYSGD